MFHLFAGLTNADAWDNYIRLNAQIELISQVLYYLATRFALIGLMSPSLLVTLVNYFYYDLGNESYYLSCPLLYVQKSRA